MKILTKAVLCELKAWKNEVETHELQKLYLQVLELYIEGNYPKGINGETLMCSIHESFTEGHNCLGCNLQEQSSLIIKFLAGYKSFSDLHLVSTNFHLLLYLLAERYLAYIEMIELQQSQRSKYFSVFQRIIQWANFLKHPKAFTLVHHATYCIDGMSFNNAINYQVIINDEFVKTYYSNSDQNGKLRGKLSKQEGVVVKFPNPVNLMEDFVKAQVKFVNLIKNNSIIREIFESEASVKNVVN